MLALPIGIPFAGSGGFLLLGFYRHTVWYDARIARVTNEWGQQEVFYFSDVRAIRLKKLSGNLRLTLNDGRAVYVNPYLKGYAGFRATVEAFIPID